MSLAHQIDRTDGVELWRNRIPLLLHIGELYRSYPANGCDADERRTRMLCHGSIRPPEGAKNRKGVTIFELQSQVGGSRNIFILPAFDDLSPMLWKADTYQRECLDIPSRRWRGSQSL